MSHDATKNLNDVMRKYDRESNTRAWEGKPKIAVQAYLAAFAIFEVYVTLFGTMLDEVRLTSFVGGLLIAGFLIFPSHKHEFRDLLLRSLDHTGTAGEPPHLCKKIPGQAGGCQAVHHRPGAL